MEYYLLIARSLTQAQYMVRLLGGCDIRSSMFRAPAGLTNRGCSYAVRFRPEHWRRAQQCLDQAGVRPLAVYRREGKRYQEVKE